MELLLSEPGLQGCGGVHSQEGRRALQAELAQVDGMVLFCRFSGDSVKFAQGSGG